jgi:hypothetical protein
MRETSFYRVKISSSRKYLVQAGSTVTWYGVNNKLVQSWNLREWRTHCIIPPTLDMDTGHSDCAQCHWKREKCQSASFSPRYPHPSAMRCNSLFCLAHHSQDEKQPRHLLTNFMKHEISTGLNVVQLSGIFIYINQDKYILRTFTLLYRKVLWVPVSQNDLFPNRSCWLYNSLYVPNDGNHMQSW